MPPQEHVFDLGKFAFELRRRGQHKNVVDAIFSALDAHSAQADLQSALDALAALKGFAQRDDETFDNHAIALALLSNAVILYARATHTQQKARKTFNIASRLTPGQKIVHRELYDLRNDAIAHFGTGKSYSGPNWVRETALFYIGPHGSKFGISSRRFTFDRSVVDRINAQVAVAHGIMTDIRAEKSTFCATLMNGLLKGNRAMLELLATFGFDPYDFLGGAVEADAFYKSLQSGHERTFVKGSEQYGDWLPQR